MILHLGGARSVVLITQLFPVYLATSVNVQVDGFAVVDHLHF